MKSYNNVTIVGRAVREPDFKQSDTNNRANFTVAVDRPYKDSDGKHPTDFLNIVTYGKLADICNDYIKKGCLILISGRIQTRSYEVDRETKWITEIVGDSINVLEYRDDSEKKTKKTKAQVFSESGVEK